MRIIDDEFALPAPDDERSQRLEYVRSKCDPAILIAARSGETFTRRDGKPWEWPGYKISNEGHGRVTREPATGIEDTVRYRGEDAETVDHMTPKKPKQAAA